MTILHTHTLKLERLAKGWAGPPGRTAVMASLGLIPIGTRGHLLLSSCLAEIAAKVVSSDPSELPKAAPPMV